MGRLPKPSTVLELEKGKLYDKQRDRVALEPKPAREIKPRCPKRFSKEERRAWKEIAAVLKNYGLFTAANAIQLELLATAWTQYLACCKGMLENPKIVGVTKEGRTSYNPFFQAQHKLGTLVDKYSSNLGLSSIALAKIGGLILKSKREKEEDDFFQD